MAHDKKFLKKKKREEKKRRMHKNQLQGENPEVKAVRSVRGRFQIGVIVLIALLGVLVMVFGPEFSESLS